MDSMKKRRKLDTGWQLRQVGGQNTDWMTIEQMPAQVADVLFAYGKIPETVKIGWCEPALWISDFEWEYKYKFPKPEGKKNRLVFEGLDTIATVYLNGEEVGKHDDFYMPCVVELTGRCKAENELVIRFHRALEWLRNAEMPEYLEDAVLKCKLLRKPIHDFPLANGREESSYQGAVPSFTPVGIYGDVYMETWEDIEIVSDNISAEILHEQGIVKWELEGRNTGENQIEAEVSVYLEEGLIESRNIEIPTVDGRFYIRDSITIYKPKLWWPIGFGEHTLYQIEILLKEKDGKVADSVSKNIGFRTIESPEPLSFLINGKRVRLWGGSMDPMQGYTHCYQQDRAERVFDMIENANMNALRIWGEGIPLPDIFYQEADRRGVLIWQEFFLGHGAYPDSEDFGEKCVKEAEILVRRLRHHACILMWCGGNETIMGAEYAGKQPFGDWIPKYAFPKLLERLGEKRYYHVNSPYGGEWANDPRTGDSHTYECVWEYPYKDYPNFLSESIRTAPPAKHSLERIIRGPIWPAGYDGKVSRPGQGIMPSNWLQRIHPFSDGERYSGNYWEYYDCSDLDSMLFRFGAAYGAAIMEIGGQVRRGSKEHTEFVKRSKGYMACKLLDTWPKIFCAIIDYFQEGYIPYYATKRVLSPLMVSFAKEERIRLFAVNDWSDSFEGMVETGIYNLRTERFERREIIPVYVEQGDFAEIIDLSKYHFFSRDCILYARMMDRAGTDVYTCIDYVDVERHLPFGEPELKVEIAGDTLTIEAKHFARCVEITGQRDMDKFGWLFTDNYFDLMPGTRKKVKILGKHTFGTISVKAQYSSVVHKIQFDKEKVYEESITE